MAWKLYYDGGCNLCHASQLQAERWARRSGRTLLVDILLSDEAISKRYGPQMTLEADGRVLTSAEAWMALLTLAPWYLRWLSWLRFTPATMAVARLGYWLVSKSRYALFGRRTCTLPK